MIHLAVPSRSVHADRPYTTPGLGDRAHTMLLGWSVAKMRGRPVRLHLTGEKMTGGAPGTDKVRSWRDLEALYPPGVVSLHFHPDAVGMTEGSGWTTSSAESGRTDVTSTPTTTGTPCSDRGSAWASTSPSTFAPDLRSPCAPAPTWRSLRGPT